MKLNINQKLVLLINLLEFAKTVYPPNQPLPPLIQARARKVVDWLHAHAHPESPESQKLLAQEPGLPPPEPGEEYGAVEISTLELGDGITALMEAIVAAELSPDRIPDPPAPYRRVRKGRVAEFSPRRGNRGQR